MDLMIKKLRFSSYIKLVFLMAVSMGIAMGIIIFVISLLGGNATATVGSNQLTGLSAGIVGLFITPLTMLIMGAIFALVSYFPFLLMLRLTSGIVLKGDIFSNQARDAQTGTQDEVHKNDADEDQYQVADYQHDLPEQEMDNDLYETGHEPIMEITDLQQFRDIVMAGRGYIVITDKANPIRVHKTNCSWVKEENFITKVIDNARILGKYYWVESKLLAEEMGATRCGKCM